MQGRWLLDVSSSSGSFRRPPDTPSIHDRLPRAIYELWSHASSYDLLHERNESDEARTLWQQWKSIPFKFVVTAIQHTIPPPRVKDIMNGFIYMDYEKIDLKDPEATVLWVCEECESPLAIAPPKWMAEVMFYSDEDERGCSHSKTENHLKDGDFLQVYFGRLVRPSAYPNPRASSPHPQCRSPKAPPAASSPTSTSRSVPISERHLWKRRCPFSWLIKQRPHPER